MIVKISYFFGYESIFNFLLRTVGAESDPPRKAIAQINFYSNGEMGGLASVSTASSPGGGPISTFYLPARTEVEYLTPAGTGTATGTVVP